MNTNAPTTSFRIANVLIDFFIIWFFLLFFQLPLLEWNVPYFFLPNILYIELTNFFPNLVYSAYCIIFCLLITGRTIGKHLVGIKIVKMDSSPLTFKDLFFREFVGKFLLGYLSLGIVPLISFFMIINRLDKRAIHDLIANTKIIYK